jgi:hypothetical protein
VSAQIAIVDDSVVFYSIVDIVGKEGLVVAVSLARAALLASVEVGTILA